jgi:hypothetical protein
VASLGHLGQADGAGLVGVQQALVGAVGPVHSRAEQLVRGPLTIGSCLQVGKACELCHQPCRIGEEAGDMVPDRGFDLHSLDVAARAFRWSSG